MNFWKIVKISFRHRLSIALCIITAIGVGILWGMNLSAVFPFMQITFKGQTMQNWAAESVLESQGRITELEKKLSEIQNVHSKEGIMLKHKLQMESVTLRGYESVQRIFESILPRTPFATIVVLLAALLGLTLLKILFLVMNSVLVSRIANLTIYDVRNQLYNKCLEFEMAHYSQEGTAVLMSRITNDVKGIGDGLSELYGKLIREPLKMFVCLGIALWISWQLFVITLFILPVIAWAIQKLAKKIRKTSRQIMMEVAKLYQTIQETFLGIKIVKCFSLEEKQQEQFYNQGFVIYRNSLTVAFLDVLAKGLVEFSGILLVSIALLVGAWLVLTGNTTLFGFPMAEHPLSIEWLVMFYVALLGAADPARKLSDIFTSLQNAAAVADRVYELLETPIQISDPKTPVPLQGKKLDLVFSDVKFNYSPDRPVLKNINYTIPFGKTVAFVGANGCGKSTLLNLVPRLADPTEGVVSLGGVSLREAAQKEIHSLMGLVSQDAILFDDSVMENIRRGRLEASDAEVIEAAKKAKAHEFITTVLPQGYATSLGPMGNLLSGGQRQRIALARVILRNPQILLLDEATSQIDLESERAIQESLAEFHQNRTVLLVTHRLSLLGIADEIVVMENGRIVDFGTHDELMKRNLFFQKLFQEN